MNKFITSGPSIEGFLCYLADQKLAFLVTFIGAVAISALWATLVTRFLDER